MPASPAFAEMVHGVEDAAAERGLTLLLANSAEDSEREQRAVRTLLDRRVDGLILARAAIRGARQDETIHAALEQRADGSLLTIGVLGGICQQQRQAPIGGGLLDTVRHLGEGRLAGVRHHKPDAVGFGAAHSPGQRVCR